MALCFHFASIFNPDIRIMKISQKICPLTFVVSSQLKVKEVISTIVNYNSQRSDDLWHFACGDVFLTFLNKITRLVILVFVWLLAQKLKLQQQFFTAHAHFQLPRRLISWAERKSGGGVGKQRLFINWVFIFQKLSRFNYENNNIYIYCPSRGLLRYSQPRSHQLPPWPGAVFCYEFFTKNNIFLFQGLASNIDRFVEEEVEVRHIPHLSDGDLRSLGFVTIGSRQRIRSAATAWVPQVICLCSSDSHVLKKVLYKYNDMFFFSREIWYQKSHTYVSSHRLPIPRRCQRGRMLNKLQMWTRKKERERSCELVWCLEIMCIFSHESIEKSLPHNLQEPNSRGEDNREESETPDVNEEDGEREVLWIDLVLKCNMVPQVIVDSKSFSTQNAQEGYWLGAQM